MKIKYKIKAFINDDLAYLNLKIYFDENNHIDIYDCQVVRQKSKGEGTNLDFKILMPVSKYQKILASGEIATLSKAIVNVPDVVKEEIAFYIKTDKIFEKNNLEWTEISI